MANSIIKARNWKIVNQIHIDGRSFGLVLPYNIANCAAEACYGRVKTNLGQNAAGLYFFKNVEDQVIAVDITKIDLIKVYQVAA